jgi:acyl dehydratase
MSRLSLGDALPEIAMTPSRTHFVRFAGAGGDFNPVHHDEVHARSLGHPSVFAMGMWTASIAARVLTDFFGPGSLRAYRVRFAGLVWPDQPLQFRASIAAKREDAMEIAVSVESGGETKMTAVAEIAMTSPDPPVPG